MARSSSTRASAVVILALLAASALAGIGLSHVDAASYKLKARNGDGHMLNEFRLGDVVRVTLIVTTGAESTEVVNRLDVTDALTGAFLGTYDDGKPGLVIPPYTYREVALSWPQSTYESGAVGLGRYALTYAPLNGDGASATALVDVEYAPDFDLIWARVESPPPNERATSPPYEKRFLLCIGDGGTEPVPRVPVRITYAKHGEPEGSAAHVLLETEVTLDVRRQCGPAVGGGYAVELKWAPTVEEVLDGALLARNGIVTLDPEDGWWEFDETNNVRGVRLGLMIIP